MIQAIQLGIPVARAELVDERSIEAMNRYAGLGLPASPQRVRLGHGAGGPAAALAGSARGALRGHGAPPRRRDLATDVCVPISRLAECIRETQADTDGSTIEGGILGHVGDGNFHCAYVLDPGRPADLEEARRLNQRLVARALRMGGTCTGEHGIGIGKMASLVEEHGDAIPAMRAIKRALDPANLLNPGKIFALDSDERVGPERHRRLNPALRP